MTETVLTVWTITRNTVDYGDKFVARPHHVGHGFVALGAEAFVADTLEEVRDMLPFGLTRMDRQPDDEPCIVESWL